MRRENNPNKVKSGSRVSFADDVGKMGMRMDWELPGFKRNANKSESITGPSGEFLHLVCLQIYSS